MIKNYKQFNESVLQHLEGPTEDEVLKYFNDMNPEKMLKSAVDKDLLDIVKLALKKNVDKFRDDEVIEYLYKHKLITEKEFLKGTKYFHANRVLQLSIDLKIIEGIKNSLKHGAKLYLSEFDIFEKIIKLLNLNDDEIYEMLFCVDSPKLLLRISAYIGCLQGAIYALDSKNTDVHDENDYALRTAANNGFTEIVRVTLQHGAYPSKCNNILKDIKKNGYNEILELLKEYESNNDDLIYEFSKKSPDDLLYYSCENQLFKGIKKAIELGADIGTNDFMCFDMVKDYPEMFNYLKDTMKLPKTLKEYLDKYMNGIEEIKQEKYPDTKYWGKDDEILFELDEKYNIFLINRRLIFLADNVYINEPRLDHRKFFEILKPYVIKKMGLTNVIYSNDSPHWTHDVPDEIPHAAYSRFYNVFEYFKDKRKRRKNL